MDVIWSAITGGGGGGAGAEDAALLGDLLLEVIRVEGVVAVEESPAAGVAGDLQQPEQQRLRHVAVPVTRHEPRHPLDPLPLLRRRRRRWRLHWSSRRLVGIRLNRSIRRGRGDRSVDGGRCDFLAFYSARRGWLDEWQSVDLKEARRALQETIFSLLYHLHIWLFSHPSIRAIYGLCTWVYKVKVAAFF